MDHRIAAVAFFVVAALAGCDRGDAPPAATAPASATTAATSTATITAATAHPIEELVALENLAVGQMGRFEFDAAAGTLSDLLARDDTPDARVNLAIAMLNRQREGDEAAAMRLVDEVLRRHPDHLRAQYVKALLLLNEGDPGEALNHFRSVAAADPSDSYAVYHIGQCLAALGKHEEALAAYEQAATIDPTLRSAHYGAFQALQRLNRPLEAKERLERFQTLKDHLQARLVEFKYTRMGPKAEAMVSRGVSSTPAARARPSGATFEATQALPLLGASAYDWSRLDSQATLTVADIDQDGAVDVFIAATGSGLPNAILLNRGNAFELAHDHPLAAVTQVTTALWGDFDNDGLTDVYLCRTAGNQLWRQDPKGSWRDVTDATGTAQKSTAAAAFFDADHDGDLDLMLAAGSGPNELLSNNGDGTFRPVGAETGLAGDGRSSAGLVVNDLDNDGDADIIVLKATPPHEVYLNDLMWKYRPAPGFESFANAPIIAVAAADTDADGQVELYAATSEGRLRWTRDPQGQWQSERLGGGANMPFRMMDVDGSGQPAWLEAAEFHQWETVLLDPARGPAIIGLRAGEPPMVRLPGPGRHPFMALTLTGRSRLADQMRSNASGIGVKIAARVGDRWIATDTYPRGSAGQSLQPVAFGLGGAASADFVRLTWPDGLMQTELQLASSRRHEIEETQRQTSSCPVLFAWDGERFAFVTDVLGVGGIGFSIAPGEYLPPRPWENLLLPADLLRSIDGRYILKLGEPMQEACYLDSVSLVRYALPPGWSMTLDERLAVNDPQRTGAPRFFRREIPPHRAVNDRGRDVTAVLMNADGVAAPAPPLDRRFIGRTAPHQLTLQFNAPLDGARAGEPMLVIDGWVEYPYAQTMFAAWQAGASYDAPTLEAQGADGRWVTVLEQFGYPAGMPRQMSVPLPVQKLPPRTMALRLRTTQEIYFDRIAVAWSEPCPEARRTELKLHSATLDDIGFAARTTGPQRRPYYDYDCRAPLWDARHQSGFYSALGPVDELIGASDSAVAIFGPGEEVHLEFLAPPPAPLAGWTQRLVLELTGWCKDADLYTKDGQTIEPLPVHADSPQHCGPRDALHRRYNTRYRSGG